MNNEYKMKCELCKRKIPFNELIYIKNKKGTEYQEHKDVKTHIDGDEKNKERIFYHDRLFVCGICRNDRRLYGWRNREVKIQNLTVHL